MLNTGQIKHINDSEYFYFILLDNNAQFPIAQLLTYKLNIHVYAYFSDTLWT